MIRQFALEYASKCLLHTSTNGVTTKTSTPPTDTPDVPLDLTVSRTIKQKECDKELGRNSLQQSIDLSDRHLKIVQDGVMF